MGEFTPLECFLAGVALVSTILAIFLLFAFKAISNSITADRKRISDSIPNLNAVQFKDQNPLAIQQQLQEIEKRLTEIEKHLRRQVVA